MKVVVHLTIDGVKETMLEGDAHVFEGAVTQDWGILEDREIGFWLSNWKYCQVDATTHKKSMVFCPWSSVLFVETKE